jgi:hypothetical protein
MDPKGSDDFVKMSTSTSYKSSYVVPTLSLPLKLILIGPSGSGKSTWVELLLRHQMQVIIFQSSSHLQPPFRNILVCYRSWQKLYSLWLERYKNQPQTRISFYKSIPSNLEDIIVSWNGSNSLVLIDDAFDRKDSVIADLFTRICHHTGTSCIVITQVLFQRDNPVIRTIQLNSSGLVLFKSIRDQSASRFLAYQIFPEREKANKLQAALRDAVNQKYGYLYLDFSQDCPDDIRFRTNIFSEHQPYPIVYTI